MPSARRGAHAALSPNFGAPAMPAPWHTLQVVSKIFLPSGLAPAAGAAAAVVGAAAGAAVWGAPGAGLLGAAAWDGMAPALAVATPTEPAGGVPGAGPP